MIDKRIFNGIDIKRFQYEEHATSFSDKKIDIIKIIENSLLKRPIDVNCIMINIEKDKTRYNNTIEELKKVGIYDFSHLKATYWKEKEKFKEDLNFVIDFLKEFNKEIPSTEVKFDEFSHPSDSNILIQDGPLACYVSHLRAMIWGWSQFKDYTIIVEDDISITNTEFIEKYLQKVPDDWDIVMLNACPKNKLYNDILYKFDNEFHSCHFYIINNKCLPYLFKNLYPITDQVDVLVSNCYKNLNIYNIEEVVYQKNISTNTQNNLHVILTSPNYQSVRDCIKKVENGVKFFLNKMLPGNNKRNKILIQDLMFDILYEYIVNNETYIQDPNKEDFKFDNSKYENYPEYIETIKSLDFIIQCSKKGITSNEASILFNTFLFTIDKFNLHNTLDIESNENLKAYGFGSTSHTYLLRKNKIIVKKYNDKLRWVTKGHNNSLEIFNKEINILNKIQSLSFSPKLIKHDSESKTIKMSYMGKSLYEDFTLPKNWETQIIQIFKELTKNGIYYPEFRLQNILILNGKIGLIDYGLAEFSSTKVDNSKNSDRFTKYLKVLQDKLSPIKDKRTRLQLISTFFINLDI